MPEAGDEGQNTRITRALLEVSRQLERSKIAEYVTLLNTPGRLIYLNFLAGIARGVGFAVGASVLAALLIYFLQRSFVVNLPIIGGFIAQIVEIVLQQLRAR
ncbi:MAG: DUF5665 domain-containing protein [Bacillota bacterium]